MSFKTGCGKNVNEGVAKRLAQRRAQGWETLEGRGVATRFNPCLFRTTVFCAVRHPTALQWPTTIFFAISSQLGFLLTDMHFGSRLRPEITLRVSATLVTLAGADSTVSSIFCCQQIIHLMNTLVLQITTHHSIPESQDISYLVYFVKPTLFRPVSAGGSQLDPGIRPQGC